MSWQCIDATRCYNDNIVVERTGFDFAAMRHRVLLSLPSAGRYRLTAELLRDGARELVHSEELDVLPKLCGPTAVLDASGGSCDCPAGMTGDPMPGAATPCAPCAAGKYKFSVGQGECLPCGLGYFCPPGSAQREPCRAGSFCPDASSQFECASPGSYCMASVELPGAVAEDPCPAGFYCPSATVKVGCTAGQFCGPGSFEPRMCAPGFACVRVDEELPCPGGNYTMCAGSRFCPGCPLFSSPTADRTSCVCDAGYFSLFDVASASAVDPPRVHMMEGGYSVGGRRCELRQDLCVAGSALGGIEGLSDEQLSTRGLFLFASPDAYGHTVGGAAVPANATGNSTAGMLALEEGP